MIVDLERFIAAERPHWERLDARLRAMADDPWKAMSIEEARDLERLYQRAVADLARLEAFAAGREMRDYLAGVVARGYSEIHGAHAEGSRRFRPWHWWLNSFPQAWRRRAAAFWFAVILGAVGSGFGAAAVAFDPAAKQVIMPFDHLRGSPAERVAQEERASGRQLEGGKARFSGTLMTHNTRVTLGAMALGMTAGAGTLILMFYNGVILGAVALDYVSAGHTTFLLGWLLPHGAIELPAMFIGGQAGFVLAGALVGRASRLRVSQRLRAVAPDVVTLCGGAAVMLVWAGIVEAFFSQYHEPVLPYAVKIGFGVCELVALGWFLACSGRAAGTSQRT